MRLILVLILLVSFILPQTSFTQSSFSFQGTSINPGSKQHFTVPISDGKDSTFIPITIFCGAKDGPTLGITAGVHGYEYPPIMASQKLIHSIDPQQLKGVVILVQIANLSSFSNRSPFINPLDKKNLNRVFPGSERGSITERMANFITQNVIIKSDFFLDMHGGDASEDLTSYAAYYANENMLEASNIGKSMAQSLLFDYIIVFNTNEKNYIKKDQPSLYCSAEAFKRGIPSVDLECGRLGLAEPQAIQKIEQGVLNMLDQLQMLSTNTTKTNLSKYLTISNRSFISSGHTGIFYPTKQSGDYVSKGMKLGTITNFFGETLDSIYADMDGVILLIVGTPPINKGETIAVIGCVNK